jgi:hypothetical protein
MMGIVRSPSMACILQVKSPPPVLATTVSIAMGMLARSTVM